VRHKLCSPFIVRQGTVDTVVVVGRSANVEVTPAMYEWIVEQLERFALHEWLLVSAKRVCRASPWCSECED
jgi:hypothetical protein